MVSRSILKDYYGIPLDYMGFFEYQGRNYYLTKNQDLNLYQQYIYLTKFKGFQLVKNIFNQYVSQDFILFYYINNNINIDNLIKYSLKIQGKKSVFAIKRNWIKIMDEAQNYMKNKYIFHYNFALGQLAIEILNYFIKKDTEILLGTEHIYPYPDIKNICNPDNLIIAPRIQDLCYLFAFNFITEDQLKKIIIEYNLSDKDLVILLCQSIFPNSFFLNVIDQCMNEKKEKENLSQRLIHINRLINTLKKYITIPEIFWIK